MNKPIDVCPLGLLVQDRVDDLVLNLFGIVGTAEVNQVGCIFVDGLVIAELLQNGQVIVKPCKFHVTVLDFPGFEPYIHDEEQYPANDQRYISTMRKLVQVGEQKAKLNAEINNEVEVNPK